RGHAHGCINGETSFDGCRRAAIAEVERYYIGLLLGQSTYGPVTFRDKSVRCSVKPEAPNMMASVQVIRHSVEKSMLRNGMVERSIKNCYLGYVGTEYLAGRQNALDVVRVVERGQIDAILDSFEHRIRDDGGFCK